MGIFDMFLSEEKRIAKHQRTITNRDKQAEDREAAARWLSDNGSAKALVALLTRFDMKLENQLHDQAEKELVYGLLVRHGEAVEAPLERHLQKTRQIALPLRLYLELKGEQAAVEKVFELLREEHEADNFHKPKKKVDLLVWLVERRHPEAIAVVVPFLGDFDEGVRYAAAEVILAQQSDAGREPLQRVLEDPEEESNRLKVRLAEVFQQRRWTVDQPEAVAPNLPPAFSLRDGRVVAS